MVFPMNPGAGESSYSSNSFLQETVTRKAWPVLEETIKQMVSSLHLPQCFNIADLGCSAGPNSLLVMSNIIITVNNMLRLENYPGIITPEFHVFLNDLPTNDFNTLFKSLPTIYKKLKEGEGEKFRSTRLIYGVPGSFYGRLFPKESMHLIHSSYSLHWLSQVPEGLESNKGNIYMARTSPPDVFEAYLKQFQKDFFRFLQLRSVEIVPKGRMVLTFIGRSIADPASSDCGTVHELLAKSLLDLGLVQEDEIDSFNLAHYTPYKDEVKDIIQEEGSFTLDRLDTFQVNWDGQEDDDDTEFVFDSCSSGKLVAKSMRAVMEPLLASHFGSNINDSI